MGCETHAKLRWNQTKAHKSSAVVVPRPPYHDALAPLKNRCAVVFIVLPTVLRDAGARAIVVWFVRRAAQTTFALGKRFKVPSRTEQEAMRICARSDREGQKQEGNNSEHDALVSGIMQKAMFCSGVCKVWGWVAPRH